MRRFEMRKIMLLNSFSAVLYGQTTAEIIGRIVDSSNAAAPGATASNINKGTKRTTTSNDQGYYTLTSVDTGNYEVTVQLAGFKPMTRSGIKLDVNESLRLDFSLSVGEMSEKIQVVGEVAAIEPTAASLVL